MARSRKRATRVGGRSARVVAAVLEATIEELAKSGYASLSIEAVAQRAGVAKTTVYRRWPTRAALVKGALMSMKVEMREDAGSIRKDLLQFLRRRAAHFASPQGESLLKVLVAESKHPELRRVMKSVRAERRLYTKALVKRAIDRGELPRGTDPHLLMHLLLGPIVFRHLIVHEPVGQNFLRRLVDVVLAGARGQQVPLTRGRRKRRWTSSPPRSDS